MRGRGSGAAAGLGRGSSRGWGLGRALRLCFPAERDPCGCSAGVGCSDAHKRCGGVALSGMLSGRGQERSVQPGRRSQVLKLRLGRVEGGTRVGVARAQRGRGQALRLSDWLGLRMGGTLALQAGVARDAPLRLVSLRMWAGAGSAGWAWPRTLRLAWGRVTVRSQYGRGTGSAGGVARDAQPNLRRRRNLRTRLWAGCGVAPPGRARALWAPPPLHAGRGSAPEAEARRLERRRRSHTCGGSDEVLLPGEWGCLRELAAASRAARWARVPGGAAGRARTPLLSPSSRTCWARSTVGET